MKNQVMLITYGDSLGRNFRELEEIMDRHYKGAVGSIHILPFSHRSDMIQWMKRSEIFRILRGSGRNTILPVILW